MEKESNRVVVTGMGVVSTYGTDLANFWKNIKEGRSAIKKLKITDGTPLAIKYGAEVDFQKLISLHSTDLPPKHTTDRRGIMGLIAANNAIKDAGLSSTPLLKDSGVFASSGVVEITEEDRSICKNDSDPLSKLYNNRHLLNPFSGICCSNDGMVNEIAKRYGFVGPVANINAACAGGAQAIGLAYRAIKRNEASIMLCGGADSVLSLRTLIGLKLLGATALTNKFGDKLCRPFDKGRSGLVAGEGAAFLVLESEKNALKRNAAIYAEVKGYGSTLDAYKLTAPHPDGRGAVLAIQHAIKESGLKPENIQCINAHGTSTQLNDVIETKIIKSVFRNPPPMHSIKSILGHWIAAAGAVEAVTSVLTVKHNFIPPTINLTNPDPECDLDYVANQGRSTEIKNVLSNSFGFGGINACLVIGDYE